MLICNNITSVIFFSYGTIFPKENPDRLTRTHVTEIMCNSNQNVIKIKNTFLPIFIDDNY